jgi:hypothetical protein
VNEGHYIEIPKAQIMDTNDHELVTLGVVVDQGHVVQEFVNNGDNLEWELGKFGDSNMMPIGTHLLGVPK